MESAPSPWWSNGKGIFLYRRENEPELVTEHIPFLLWDGARSDWGPLVHLFILLHQGRVLMVCQTRCTEQSVMAADFIGGEWIADRGKANRFRAQSNKSFQELVKDLVLIS